LKTKKLRGAAQVPGQAANRFPERFVFHGRAVAAGAFITRIGTEEVNKISPVQAHSSLLTIGGHAESSAQSSDPALADFFSHGEARTQARGTLESSGAVTTLSASVRDVRMVNRPSPGESSDMRPIEFKAALLSLEMRATHPRKGQPRFEFPNPPQFQGMTLDNLPLEIELRTELTDMAAMAAMEKRFRGNQKFFLAYRDAFMLPDPSRPLAFGQKIPRMNTYAVCSIVRSIRWGDQKIDGHVLTKVGFGSIFFGEMLVNEFNRRVTLVRVKMGSEGRGDASFGEGDPNGTWIPPQD
jgi:hypothetical protein